MNLKLVALVATVGEVLFALSEVFPQPFGISTTEGNKIDFALVVFGSLALVCFFLVVYRDFKSLRISFRMRVTALIAGISLGMENLQYFYRTLLGTIEEASHDAIILGIHPIRYFARLLGLTTPAIASATLILFLLVLSWTALGTPQSTVQEGDRGHRRLRNGALVALTASISALARLLEFAARNFAVVTAGPLFSALVRLVFLVSMVLFFLFVTMAQTPTPYAARQSIAKS